MYLLNMAPMRDPAASVVGFACAIADITTAHQRREALIDSGMAISESIALEHVYLTAAEQLRRALPMTGLVIALVDDGTARFRVAFHDGYDDARDREDAPDRFEQQYTAVWIEALAKGAVIVADADAPTDARGRRSSESDRAIELTAPLVSTHGAVGAMVIRVRVASATASHDTETARHVLAIIAAQLSVGIERAWLVQRVEQKRRLETIGEVAAGVAHELRNPLFAISSAAQLLRHSAASDPAVEKGVARVLREVERLNRMATSLLEFGKPYVTNLVPGDPDAIWDDILEAERGRLDQKRLVLHRTRVAPELLARVDGEQLGQVFRNLLVNAIDAAPTGSVLALISSASAAGGWRMRLTNGGRAIPPDVLPHVFEFFYSAKPGGTGIGLALCQRIVDDHHGTITIDSTPESGTTVVVTLPPLDA